jgi:transposase
VLVEEEEDDASRAGLSLLGVSHLVATATGGRLGTVWGMAYSSDLTDEQWALLDPVFNAPSKRGPKHAADLRSVVNAMLYISHTGCQWRFLPESFGPWTRVWSQFRRWSRNGTWARALTVLHAASRESDGRAEATPSMVVIDPHLARGASNGGSTFHDRGGPCGRTRGAKRIVAVDVTGLPAGALVVPASTHENRASELMLGHLDRQGITGRLELVLVDRGVTAAAARTLGRLHDLEMRRVAWDDKQPVFRPIRHAWRVEVAHGRLGRSRRLAKSFENTTTSATGWLQVACIATTLRHLSRARAHGRALPVAA